MTSNNGNEKREFWIEQFNGRRPPSYYAFKDKPNFNKVVIKVDGKEFPGSEYFHVISIDAYRELEAKLEKAEAALENIEKYAANDIHRQIIAREALKELRDDR